MKSGIYQIQNSVNGKRYVGSAASLRTRLAVHRHGLSKGKHHSRYLQNAVDKYGIEVFRFETLLFCAPKDLLFYEQRALDLLNPEYNISRTAGSCLGVKHSETTRRKRSLLNIGNKFCVGRTPSAACREAVAEANRRRKGQKRSPEAVAATAAAHRGMKRSAETRARISAAKKGKKPLPQSQEPQPTISTAVAA